MLIKTTSGVELGGAESARAPHSSLSYVDPDTTHRVEFRFLCALNPGVYFLNAGVVGDIDGSTTYLHRLIDIALFRVLPDADSIATGIVDFACYPVIEFHSLQG
jgi:lipopolysaccharide transport system ATP-binding protein